MLYLTKNKKSFFFIVFKTSRGYSQPFRFKENRKQNTCMFNTATLKKTSGILNKCVPACKRIFTVKDFNNLSKAFYLFICSFIYLPFSDRSILLESILFIYLFIYSFIYLPFSDRSVLLESSIGFVSSGEYLQESVG